MIIISISITILYLILIAGFAFGFDKVKVFTLSDIASKTTFSIIIPFRNEAQNLLYVLNSLAELNYPKHLFEIILVDDDSVDTSVEIINEFAEKKTSLNIKIIKNKRTSNSPKKDAISTAIKQTKTEWLITTDADCIVPKYWLDSFDEFIQKTDTKCIVAPVSYIYEGTFLNRFQILDSYSLQGATIGSFGLKKPFLCNGANFAYTKTDFNKVEGFKGNDTIASGDDIFLLEKFTKKFPKYVHYLKSEKAIVYTKTEPTWQKLKSQRLRWAAKTGAYTNALSKLTALTVFFMNLLILVLPSLTIFHLFSIKIWVYIFVIKLNIDFLLLYKTSAFFGQRQAFRSFLTSFFVYPFFSVYIAILSIFKSYQWKERTFKR